MLVPTSLLLIVTVLLFAYIFAVRPWHTAWGATHVDRVVKLPGDDFSKYAYHTITHAVNIQAPPEAIWPWLVQIGQDRAGFYSYTFLENLVGAKMPNVHTIVPEWQARSAGDTLWLATRERHGDRGRRIALIVEPQRSITMVSPADWKLFQAGQEGLEGSWTFALLPKPGGSTRLVARLRMMSNPSVGARIVNYIFWEPAHFFMERKMLLTIKHLAEKHTASQT